jgi:uncharacterized protein
VEKIIDAHIHLSERRDDALLRFAKMNGLNYTLEELVGSMQSHLVEHGLLLSPPMNDGNPLPNAEIIKLCRRSRGLLLPGITVEPNKKAVASAVELADDNSKEVKAFKVRLGYVDAPADDPVFGDVYDFAEDEGLPVLFHTGDTASDDGDLMFSHPLTLDRLANKRAELTIVLCHFGNPWFEDVAEMIYKHPNVYADMSGLTTGGGEYPQKFAGWLARKISEAVYFAGGADKILFGSDYPVTKISDALNLVELLDIDEADKRNILWNNAKRVFGL